MGYRVACTRLKITQGQSNFCCGQLTLGPVHPSVRPSVRPSVCLSVCPYVCPSVHLSVHQSACWSVGQSQVKSATMRIYEAAVGFFFVCGVGEIVNGGCTPLPTHPLLFCDPVSLFYVVCRHFYLIVSRHW